MLRKFQQTHPWLTFQLDTRRFPYQLWIALGQAVSNCEHIAGVPLHPEVADELQKLYMAKGAFATTAIEGNSLTEEQVRQHLAGELRLPPSKAYLQQEIDNVVDAFDHITSRCLAGEIALTPAEIRDYNRRVLRNLTLDEDVVPGELRFHSVAVMKYLGAPAEDCEYLLAQLCEWLGNLDFNPPGRDKLLFAVLRAILGHLYVAWIHPFGDGNGRTARLVEYQILVSAGLPVPAAHLLSNYYNQTRQEYYRQLGYASRSGGDVIPFISYAVTGLVEGLQEQIEVIRQQQWEIAWRDYVLRLFSDSKSAMYVRQRELALALSHERAPVPAIRVSTLTPQLAQLYALVKSSKTISRDLQDLVAKDLVLKVPGGYVVNRDKVLQFLPLRYSK